MLKVRPPPTHHCMPAVVMSIDRSIDCVVGRRHAAHWLVAVAPVAGVCVCASVRFILHSIYVDGRAHAGLSRRAQKTGRYDEAEQLYRHALSVNGNNPTTLGNFANFMKKIRGKPREAKELYLQVRVDVEKHLSFQSALPHSVLDSRSSALDVPRGRVLRELYRKEGVRSPETTPTA